MASYTGLDLLSDVSMAEEEITQLYNQLPDNEKATLVENYARYRERKLAQKKVPLTFVKYLKRKLLNTTVIHGRRARLRL